MLEERHDEKTHIVAEIAGSRPAGLIQIIHSEQRGTQAGTRADASLRWDYSQLIAHTIHGFFVASRFDLVLLHRPQCCIEETQRRGNEDEHHWIRDPKGFGRASLFSPSSRSVVSFSMM